MRVAIMQPYFMPYLPYWQMIVAVDTFVVYDDVNYIKKGWINRNYILLNNAPHLFTIPLLEVSQFKHINQLNVTNNLPLKQKLLRKICAAYKKAPYFDDVYPILLDIILGEYPKFVDLLMFQFKKISNYLNIPINMILSSSLKCGTNLKGADRLIAICKLLNADIYINSIGGKNLYSKELFNINNIALYFVESKSISYKQFNCNFIPNLSIIDILMFNHPYLIREYMKAYELV